MNNLLPFQLCWIGCKRCCFHCSIGCEQCCISFNDCIIPCCKKMGQYCQNIFQNISFCQIFYQSCCGQICNCSFRCSNPCLIENQLSEDQIILLSNYDFIDQEILPDYGEVQIYRDKITQQTIALKIIDNSNKNVAKQLYLNWYPRLKDDFPHIILLQKFFQKQIDGFLNRKIRSYLFFDYILYSMSQELDNRINKKKQFQNQEILSYFLAVLSAILYLELKGINPSYINLNQVYLNEKGIIKLLDPSFFTQNSPFQYEQQKRKKWFKSVNFLDKQKYYLAPEQYQGLINEQDESRSNSCLFTLAIKAIELIILTKMDDCFQQDINYDLLQNRINEASQNVSLEFMMILNSCLQKDPNQRLSLSIAYQLFFNLQETQELILNMPKEFTQAYYKLLNNDDLIMNHQINNAQIQIKQQDIQNNKIQQQQNAFDIILKQKNYQIGVKQETAFSKILKEKNYKIGKPIRQKLELNTPNDSFFDILDKYRQQPLIIYQEQQQQQQEQSFLFIKEQYPNGCIYEGYKQNGLREGKGKYIHPSGAYYEGQWHLNKMEGQGKFYNGDYLLYDGQWKDDEQNGYGREYNDDPNNLGQVNYQDFSNIEEIWITYEGTFQNDKRHGQGIIEFVNGAKFEGQFQDGIPQGNGKYVYQAQIIIGQWQQGIKVE